MGKKVAEVRIEVVPTLRVLMAVHGLEIGELAHLTGLSPQVVSKAMHGKRISIESAEKISSAVQTPLDQIVGLNYERRDTDHHEG